jgi:Cof subfamily protein (haloacid dehalogenase superfamily)
MKKYIFFDIDGTLTSLKTGAFVESALESIQRLQDEGHFVAIATGRAYYKAKDAMKQAGIHHMVCNGGAGIVINDELVDNRPLDKEKALLIIKEARSKGYGVLVACDDSVDVYMKDDLFIRQVGERKEPTNYILDENLSFDDLPHIYKIYIAISEEEERNLQQLDLLGHMRFVKDYLMYQHDEKHLGIKRMIQHVHGSLDDVVVFGDGENDMIMFQDQFYKIAMGNGYPDLLKKADEITDPPEENGIKNACIRHKWIKNF